MVWHIQLNLQRFTFYSGTFHLTSFHRNKTPILFPAPPSTFSMISRRRLHKVVQQTRQDKEQYQNKTVLPYLPN
ncbi:hypothetical protein L1887_38154 [Cichorium endivia]|nr:hypothetical protein L1887_38154 [Cichorium endivia]